VSPRGPGTRGLTLVGPRLDPPPLQAVSKKISTTQARVLLAIVEEHGIGEVACRRQEFALQIQWRRRTVTKHGRDVRPAALRETTRLEVPGHVALHVVILQKNAANLDVAVGPARGLALKPIVSDISG